MNTMMPGTEKPPTIAEEIAKLNSGRKVMVVDEDATTATIDNNIADTRNNEPLQIQESPTAQEEPAFEFGNEFIESLGEKDQKKIKEIEKEIALQIQEHDAKGGKGNELDIVFRILKEIGGKGLVKKYDNYMKVQREKSEAAAVAENAVETGEEKKEGDAIPLETDQSVVIPEEKSVPVNKNSNKINGSTITLNGKPLAGSIIEEDKKPVKEKIILTQEQFKEKYKDILNEDLYDKDGDLLKIVSFDEGSSLINVLVHSKPRKVRVDIFDELYVLKYHPKKEEEKAADSSVEKNDEKNAEVSFEKIKKDIDITVAREKKIMLTALDREARNLGYLKGYKLYQKELIADLIQYLGEGASEEDKKAAIDLLKEEIRKANEEIGLKFENLKAKKEAEKIANELVTNANLANTPEASTVIAPEDESEKDNPSAVDLLSTEADGLAENKKVVETPEEKIDREIIKRERKEELKSFVDSGLRIFNSEEVKNIKWKALGFNADRKKRTAEVALENGLSRVIQESTFFAEKADRLAKMLAKKIIKDNLEDLEKLEN